jgi:hypothetical protein
MKHTKPEHFTRTLRSGKHFRHVQFYWADPASPKPGLTHARVIVEAQTGDPIRREFPLVESTLTKDERQTLNGLLEKLIAESIAKEGFVEEDDGEEEEG